MPRLFTALEVPRDAALSLSLLRGGIPGARWIDVENYHLTLRFIGDVDGHLADEIAHGLDRVHRPSFDLLLSGVGAFGSRKPHAIYAAARPSPELTALQAEIDRICTRAGAPSDQRKFVPHVTLARLRNERKVELAFEDKRLWDIRRWRIGTDLFRNTYLHGLWPYLKYENGQYKYLFTAVSGYPIDDGLPRIFNERDYYSNLAGYINTNEQIINNP